MKILSFFLFLLVIFDLLDPDPDPCGSGSETLSPTPGSRSEDTIIEPFSLRILGFRAVCQHGSNIPGYWPEENNQLGLLAYHTR